MFASEIYNFIYIKSCTDCQSVLLGSVKLSRRPNKTASKRCSIIAPKLSATENLPPSLSSPEADWIFLPCWLLLLLLLVLVLYYYYYYYYYY